MRHHLALLEILNHLELASVTDRWQVRKGRKMGGCNDVTPGLSNQMLGGRALLRSGCHPGRRDWSQPSPLDMPFAGADAIDHRSLAFLTELVLTGNPETIPTNRRLL